MATHYAGSGWTDDRVELMAKLWQDGLSASQIAKQLGGVTRNAVIGKAHRLGMVPGSGKPGSRSHAAKPRAIRADGPVRVAPAAPRPLLAGNGAVFHHPEPRPPREVVRFVDEAPGAATMTTLRNHMCKWPIGDPAAPGFTYCGAPADPGRPYCANHAQVAYQPPGNKSRSATELARSLRRYT